MANQGRLVNELYFDWLARDKAYDDTSLFYDYEQLCHILHRIPFTAKLEMDANRADDGIQLRYRFGYEKDFPEDEISYLDGTCSMLEFMVGLALAIEETIMMDDDLGSRVHLWFQEMLENVGMGRYTNSEYLDTWDEDDVEDVCNVICERNFDELGGGGFFPLTRLPEYGVAKDDQRNVEFWYQANAYFSENHNEFDLDLS